MNLKSLIIVITSLISQTTLASLLETYSREVDVNSYTSAFYKYKKTRDKYYFGDKGLLKEAKSFQNSAELWLKKWRQVGTQISTDETSEIAEIESMIANLLQNQSRELANLAERLKVMRSLGGRIESGLSAISTLEDSEVFGAHKGRLEEVGSEMRDQTVAIIKASEEQFSALEKMPEAYSLDFFVKHLRLGAIQRGIDETGPLVQRMSEYIRAESLGQPIVKAVENATNRIRGRAINLEAMTLKNDLEAFKDTCRQKKTEIEQLTQIGDQKTRLQQQIQNICDAELSHYQNSILIYTPQQLAESMHRNKITKYRQSCQNRASEACHLYSWLKGISLDRVREYSVKDISILEKLWIRMAGGQNE